MLYTNNDISSGEIEFEGLTPAKDALAIYHELVCDWPPITLSEARTLSEAFFLGDKVLLLKNMALLAEVNDTLFINSQGFQSGFFSPPIT